MTEPEQPTKLRLVLDLEYERNGVPIWELKDRLNAWVRTGAGDGAWTGETEATIENWSHRIEQELKISDIQDGGNQREEDLASHVIRFMAASKTVDIARRLFMELNEAQRLEAIRRLVNVVVTNPGHVFNAKLEEVEWAYGRKIEPKVASSDQPS